MSILGNRVLRKEDPKFLTSGATYVADLHDARLANAAYVTYVRATVAHATVAGVDVSAARSMPGVLGVFTGAGRRGVAAADGHGPAVPAADDDAAVVVERDGALRRRADGRDRDRARVPRRGRLPRRSSIDHEPCPVVVDMEEALSGDVRL